MSKQVTFSAAISVLTTALFALTVSLGAMQGAGGSTVSGTSPFAVTIAAD